MLHISAKGRVEEGGRPFAADDPASLMSATAGRQLLNVSHNQNAVTRILAAGVGLHHRRKTWAWGRSYDITRKAHKRGSVTLAPLAATSMG